MCRWLVCISERRDDGAQVVSSGLWVEARHSVLPYHDVVVKWIVFAPRIRVSIEREVQYSV